MEGFTDSLRREVGPYGVRVTLVEPSFLRTPIIPLTAIALRRAFTDAPAEARARWGQAYADATTAKVVSDAESSQVDPVVAVDAVERAITSASPRIRDRANWASKTFWYYLTILPAWLVDALVQAELSKTTPTPAWAARGKAAA